jgi:hypothetical protein
VRKKIKRNLKKTYCLKRKRMKKVCHRANVLCRNNRRGSNGRHGQNDRRGRRDGLAFSFDFKLDRGCLRRRRLGRRGRKRLRKCRRTHGVRLTRTSGRARDAYNALLLLRDRGSATLEAGFGTFPFCRDDRGNIHFHGLNRQTGSGRFYDDGNIIVKDG